jgi:hypothetical protein
MIAYPRHRPVTEQMYLIWLKGNNQPQFAYWNDAEQAFRLGSRFDRGEKIDGWAIIPQRREICEECGTDFKEWCFSCAKRVGMIV